MARYKLTSTDTVINTETGGWIPNNSTNTDRIAYNTWIIQGNTPDPYVAPSAPVPEVISDRQFYQQLAIIGIITQDEALASCAATIPAALLTLIAGLPSDQQFAAKMLLAGATQFQRHHPLTISIGAAYGWSSAQIDGFFTAAAAL